VESGERDRPQWPEKIELQIYHHFPQGIELRVGRLASPAVSASFKFGEQESQMASITVDTDNATATVAFEDDHGDPTSPPAGASVSFSSDTPSVLTIETDANNPWQGDITPVSEGTANISATLSGAFLADGVTPIPNPSPVAVTVGAGPAAEATLTVAEPAAAAPSAPAAPAAPAAGEVTEPTTPSTDASAS
jgi:hypothetical protein